MSDRELYEGFALQSVDEKGRVAIPADLRAALDANAVSRQVVVTAHPDGDPCLQAYDTEWSKLKNSDLTHFQRLDREAGRPVDRRAKRRGGMVEKAPYDPSGRFVLPPYFREKAGIQRWAFFVGTYDEFEIWAPEVLLASPDVEEDLRDACRFLYEKKVKA